MTTSEKLHAKIQAYVLRLEQFADRVWYPPLIAILAILDNLIVIIPTDGILVASSMLIPKRWMVYATSISIGSTIGAVILCMLVEYQGAPWVLEMFPNVDQTQVWKLTESFFDEYGLIVVFVVSLTPLMQQPVLIISALSHTPLSHLALAIFVGRFIKFMIMAYLGSHSPRLVKKIWGMKDELKDAGVKID